MHPASPPDAESIVPRAPGADPRAWAVIVYGLALALAAALLRMETSAAATAGGAIHRAAYVISTLGAVAVFEAALLSLLRIRRGGGDEPRAPARVQLVLAAVHAAAFTWLLVDHQYFLETGVRLSLEQAVVALKEFGTAAGMAGVAVDRRLPWRVAEVAACFAFAAFVASRRPWMPTLGRPAVARVAAPAAGMAIAFGGAALPSGGPDLSAQAMRAAAGFSAAEGEPYRYEAPRLLDGRAARRPNVVLVVLESTRARSTGPYQDSAEPSDTPSLDAIAAEGIVFDHVYTSVTHTSKAMVGLLCGAYPRLEVAVKESDPGGNTLTCLPKLMNELGYRTRFMQSARGNFENFPGLMANMGFQSSIMREQLGGRGFQRVGYFGMDEFALLDPAMKWIRSGDEPFFLTVLTSVAHLPYETPGVKPLEGRENALTNYRRAIRHVDEFLGAFVREVEAKAKGETIFVITADHGQAFGEHRVRAHDRVPYEEGTRVPLVVRGPRWLGDPGRVGGLRQHFDVLPTVLEWVGARWEGHVPGLGLFDRAGHDVVATSCQETRMCMGVRAGDLKFVYRYGQSRTEVYDLAHDPLEKRDLARSFPKALLARVETQAAALTDAVERYWGSGEAEGVAARPLEEVLPVAPGEAPGVIAPQGTEPADETQAKRSIPGRSDRTAVSLRPLEPNP